jgi:hypothetical protein
MHSLGISGVDKARPVMCFQGLIEAARPALFTRDLRDGMSR